MARGTVKWFNPTKGYGFIQPQGGGKDVFVHVSAVERAGLSTLNEGQAIEYEEMSNRGKTSAENLMVQRGTNNRLRYQSNRMRAPAGALPIQPNGRPCRGTSSMFLRMNTIRFNLSRHRSNWSLRCASNVQKRLTRRRAPAVALRCRDLAVGRRDAGESARLPAVGLL
jgi:cold shock protein